MSLLEAMAAGVPVVASAVGDIPLLLREGELGVLVPPGDSEALAAAIIRVAENPKEATHVARQAVQVMTGSYNAGNMGRLYRELYERALRLGSSDGLRSGA